MRHFVDLLNICELRGILQALFRTLCGSGHRSILDRLCLRAEIAVRGIYRRFGIIDISVLSRNAAVSRIITCGVVRILVIFESAVVITCVPQKIFEKIIVCHITPAYAILLPNIAVPSLTMLQPKSTARSKSPLIPTDRISKHGLTVLYRS